MIEIKNSTSIMNESVRVEKSKFLKLPSGDSALEIDNPSTGIKLFMDVQDSSKSWERFISIICAIRNDEDDYDNYYLDYEFDDEDKMVNDFLYIAKDISNNVAIDKFWSKWKSKFKWEKY